MPTHKRARELADAFEDAYPDDLPQRLQWWCRVLGVDRARFLRLMGMSPKEAKEKKDLEWQTLFRDKDLLESGWWVEGKLHELLSLFDYDWHALSERLHQPLAGADAQERNRLTRANGTIEGLQYGPTGEGSELLLNIMADRGPESLSAVLAYLANPTNRSARQ